MRDSSDRSLLRLCRIAGAILLIVFGPSRLANAADAPSAPTVINLANGGFAAGALEEIDRPDVIRWQAAPFVAPFEFPLSAVNTIKYPSPSDPPNAEGTMPSSSPAATLCTGSSSTWMRSAP